MAMWAEGTFRSVMLSGHEDAVCSLAFRGSLLASGSRDCTARLWAVRDTSGAPEAVLKHVLAHPNLVTCVALNSEASVLSSGCYDQLVRLWSTESGECTKVLTGHSGTVWAAQWSAAAPRPSQRRCSPLCSALPPPTPPLRPGGRAGPLLLSGAGYPECCVSLWDTEQGTRVASSSGHTKAVRALAVGQGALQGVMVRRVHAHYTGVARALHGHSHCTGAASSAVHLTFLPATHPGCTPSRRASAVPRPRPCHTPRPRHRHHNRHRRRGRGRGRGRGRVHSSGCAGERLLYLLWQVSGSYDLSVRLWDSATLRCVGTRLGHAREVCTRAATLCTPTNCTPIARGAASPMPAAPYPPPPASPARAPPGRSSALRRAARGSRAAAWTARSASGTAAPRAAPPRSPTAAAATSGASRCLASTTSSRAAGTAPCASGTCAACPRGRRRPRVAALRRRARRAAWSPACRPSREGSSTRRAAARWLSTTRAAGAWQAAVRAYVCGSCLRNRVRKLKRQLVR